MALQLRRFSSELKRRKVYRAAAIYAGIGFIVWQAAEFAVPALQLPDAASTLILLFTVLGFPIALVLAWAYELRPEDETAKGSGADPEPGGSTLPDRKSIVVLPFDNMSPDAGDAYFSDGLTEEIITDLSHLKGLRVISRNSAMALKGSGRSTRTVAGELGVRYVLEGSVRRAGDDLRVTAQLIDGSNDAHLWAQKYDGRLDDVFSIQEQVSRAIVDALSVELSAEESRQLGKAVIDDVRAYESYLRARADVYRWTEDGLHRALREIDNALQIAGDHPLLLSLKGTCLFHFVNQGHSADLRYIDQTEEIADRIFQLDPESSHGYRLVGLARYKRGRMAEAIHFMEKARTLDPSDPEAAVYLNYWYGSVGRSEDMGPLVQQLIEGNPLDSITWWNSGWHALVNGDPDGAANFYRKMGLMDPGNPLAPVCLGHALLRAGRDAEARDVLQPVSEQAPDHPFQWVAGLLCRGLPGIAGGAPDPPPSEIEKKLKADEFYSWWVAEGFGRLGNAERATHWLGNAMEKGFLNHPLLTGQNRLLDPIRGDGAFEALLAEIRIRWQAIAN